MEILWLAIFLYSIGLGIVLHFKPAFMFNENGTWKEFGYQRSSDTRHTLFPFWLFALSWAFVSYAIASTVTWVFPAMGLAATVSASAFGSYSQPDYSDNDEISDDEGSGAFTSVSEVVEPSRRPRGRPRKTDVKEAKQPRQGYYVLEPPTREGGLRKYIYYGSNPPSEEEA